MATIIFKKYMKSKINPISSSFFYILNLNKFLLKVLNRLLHNCKVKRLLMIKFWLDLSDYYISNSFIKLIYIFILKTKFLLLIFRQNINNIDNISYINSI